MTTSSDASAHDARKLTDADRFVGQRLKLARREMGLTQHRLAALIGITFQQVQKYEAGHSRISAGRLREMAIALAKPVDFFFEPIEPHAAPASAAETKPLVKELRREAKRMVDLINDADDLRTLVKVLSALENCETQAAD